MPTAEARPRYYCGADLHGNNVFLTVLNPSGQRVLKRRVPAAWDAVWAVLQSFAPDVQVGVESTYNWYWLVDGLQGQGLDVRLANVAQMRQYEGIKHTDDASDAAWIAEQMRLGILPQSYIYPAAVRPVRDLLRRRMLIVQQRTQNLLSLESLFARWGLEAPSATALKKWTFEKVQALKLEPFTQEQLRILLELVRTQDALARQIEQQVLGWLRPLEIHQRIQQVPGIGPLLGMVVVLESGDFGRFPSAGHYASYCRAVQSRRESNFKAKGQNNRRNGNRYLAWAFAEAAVHAIRHYPRIAAWYERKKRRRNVPVARKALACKLAKAAWHVARSEDFNEAMLFGA